MINQNRMPRYICCFMNPHCHPDPTPSDLADSHATRIWRDINELSPMARIMLWKMIARDYCNELRTEISKQDRRAKKAQSKSAQRQRG